jgi:hypothetical protein
MFRSHDCELLLPLVHASNDASLCVCVGGGGGGLGTTH